MTRRGLLIVVSVLGHALVLATIVVVSMMATGVIPTPFDRVTFAMERPVKIMDIRLPSARPAARRPVNTPASAFPQIASPEAAAPLVAPSTIAASPADNDSLASGTAEPIALNGGGSLPGFGIAEPAPPAAPAASTTAPVRASTGVRAPRKVSTVDPVYPAAARAARIEGIVIIEATIDTEGRVQSTTVLKSIPLLDRAAMDAVRQWRFTPTLLNGAAVSVILTVTVNFSLAAR